MIKLASFNIRAGMGMDGIFNIERLTKKLSSIPADFIALQEVDKGISRSQRLDEAKIFAEAIDMHYEFAKAIEFDGGEYGIALLSKAKPLSVSKFPLPGREEVRVLLVCEFENIVVCCTHLSLTEQDQITSVEIIKKVLIGKYNKPVFLMGDFNAQPASCVLESFRESFNIISDTTRFTFPSAKPEICIDYILQLKDSNFDIKDVDTYTDSDTISSDHLYVSVEIKE